MQYLIATLLSATVLLGSCAAASPRSTGVAPPPASPGYLGPLQKDAWTETKAGTLKVRLEPLVTLEEGDHFGRAAASRNGSDEVAVWTTKSLLVFDRDLRITRYALSPTPDGLELHGAKVDVLGTAAKTRYVVFRECGPSDAYPKALQVCDPLTGESLLVCRLEHMSWQTGGSVPDEHGDFAGIVVNGYVKNTPQTYFVDRNGGTHRLSTYSAAIVGHIPGAAIAHCADGFYTIKVKDGKPVLAKLLDQQRGERSGAPQRGPDESFTKECQTGPFGVSLRRKDEQQARFYTVEEVNGEVKARQTPECPASMSSRIAVRNGGVDQAVCWTWMEVPTRYGTGPDADAAPGKAQIVLRVRKEGASNDIATEFRRLVGGSPGLFCNSVNGAVLYSGRQAWRIVVE